MTDLKKDALKATDVIDKQKEKHSEIKVLDLKNILDLSDEEFELIADGKQNVDLIRQYRKIMDKEKTSL